MSGGTGSGKTTTLSALSGAIPASERIVTIEDAAELSLRQPHVVRLEARPPNVEGRGEVTIRQLVRNALRMRPDRIVVGEVRGAEALDMLMALNTGHDGSLTTVHANSPEEALRRVETLALMADVGLPHAAVREQVADAFDLVVHQSRARRRAARRPRSPRSCGSRAAPARASSTRSAVTARCGGSPPAGERARPARVRAGALGVRSRWPRSRASSGARCWCVRRGWSRAVAAALDALLRLGREGREPGAVERRQLLVLRRRRPPSAARRFWPDRSPALLLALGAPLAVSRALRARRLAYRRAVERDGTRDRAGRRRRAVAGGTRCAARCSSAGHRVGGAGGAELRRVAAELAAGQPTDAALEALRLRCPSPTIDAIVAAALVQRRSGGNLAVLLRATGALVRGPAAPGRRGARGHGAGAVHRAARGRAAARAARCWPSSPAPGSSPGWPSSPLTAWLVLVALVLQVAAAVLIRRLGRVRA